jgi:hypothetical protein
MWIIKAHTRAQALCAKCVIQALEGMDAWKMLLHCCFSQGAPLGKRSWSSLNLQTLIVTQIMIKVEGTFVCTAFRRPGRSSNAS